MPYPCWVTPTNDVLAQIILTEEEYCETDVATFEPEAKQVRAAEDALAAAQGILSLLTANRIHGPGTATDEYRVYGPVRRVSTTFRPIRQVLSVSIGDTPITVWSQIGQMINLASSLGRRFGTVCAGVPDALRVTYEFGSTVTMAARNTVLYYARQLYLAGPCGDLSACQLPERVVSLNREGISMSLVDPQTFLDRGRTGLIQVDQWLSGYLNHRGSQISGVYSGDVPPAQNISVRCD